MMWKLMDFIAESRKEKLTRKLLIPYLVQKNLLYFANYKKPTQERRNRRENFWESFSSFLIIGDHKKIWSRAKTIFGAPSLPPPFPPFPPQSSVFPIATPQPKSCCFLATLTFAGPCRTVSHFPLRNTCWDNSGIHENPRLVSTPLVPQPRGVVCKSDKT